MHVGVHTAAYARSHRFVMISAHFTARQRFHPLPSSNIFLARFSPVENAPLIKSILGNRRYMTDRPSGGKGES